MSKISRAIEIRKQIENEISMIKCSPASPISIIRLFDLYEQNNRLQSLVINEFGIHGWHLVFNNKLI